MMMKRLLPLLAVLMLLTVPALAEQVIDEDVPGFNDSSFAPLPWDVEISPILPHPDGFLPDNAGYHDDSLDIRVEKTRAYDTDVMIVYVTLSDVSQFRTTMAAKYPAQATVLVSTMAKKVHAVLAMNGDYFNYHKQGFVMRNGKVYRQAPHYQRDTLFVDTNGDFTIIRHTTQEQFDAMKDRTIHTFCFGPALVVNGEVLTDDSDIKLDLGKNKVTQRIAITQTGHLQYAIIATEGPENRNARGLKLLEMAQLCADLGFDNVFNMDGGSSSSIVLNYKKINALSSHKARAVGDAIWFATLDDK